MAPVRDPGTRELLTSGRARLTIEVTALKNGLYDYTYACGVSRMDGAGTTSDMEMEFVASLVGK